MHQGGGGLSGVLSRVLCVWVAAAAAPHRLPGGGVHRLVVALGGEVYRPGQTPARLGGSARREALWFLSNLEDSQTRKG